MLINNIDKHSCCSSYMYFPHTTWLLETGGLSFVLKVADGAMKEIR